jgi:hypothetical protein
MTSTKQQSGLNYFSVTDNGMSLSRSLKLIILIELLLPVVLLTLGIYHGLMQTVYRSGLIHETAVAHLDYYQGLTLHGVINAIVLTSFFAVAFGHATDDFLFAKRTEQKSCMAVADLNGSRNIDGGIRNADRPGICPLHFLSAS